MVDPQEHVTIATWRHPIHHQWRPSIQSDDASGPNPPPRHVSGQRQGALHHAVREVDTKADSAESVDSQKEFQIGLYDPAEADFELFCNSWSAGFLGERLYVCFLISCEKKRCCWVHLLHAFLHLCSPAHGRGASSISGANTSKTQLSWRGSLLGL